MSSVKDTTCAQGEKLPEFINIFDPNRRLSSSSRSVGRPLHLSANHQPNSSLGVQCFSVSFGTGRGPSSALPRRSGAAELVQQAHVVPELHLDGEGQRLQGQPVAVVHLGGVGRVGAEVALVGQQRGEEEQLHLGQVLSDAAPLPQGEDHHVGHQVLVQGPVRAQEARRLEGARLGPDFRVVVYGPLVDEHHPVLGHGVAHDDGVRRGAVRDGQRHEAGVAHDLVDEGHDVGQPGLVLDGGQGLAVHHLVHLLLETPLHLRKPAPRHRITVIYRV